MKEKNFKFKFSGTQEDYMKYSYFCNRINLIGILLVFLIFFIINNYYLGYSYGSDMIFALIIFMIVIGVLIFFSRKYLKKMAKKIYSDLMEGSDYSFELSKSSFKADSKKMNGSSSTELEWGKFYKIYENKNAFYFMLMRNYGFILPKRVFKDKKEIDDVRELIGESTDKKKFRSRGWQNDSIFSFEADKRILVIFSLVIIIWLMLFGIKKYEDKRYEDYYKTVPGYDYRE